MSGEIERRWWLVWCTDVQDKSFDWAAVTFAGGASEALANLGHVKGMAFTPRLIPISLPVGFECRAIPTATTLKYSDLCALYGEICLFQAGAENLLALFKAL